LLTAGDSKRIYIFLKHNIYTMLCSTGLQNSREHRLFPNSGLVAFNVFKEARIGRDYGNRENHRQGR
jgi:hypothetical protein